MALDWFSGQYMVGRTRYFDLRREGTMTEVANRVHYSYHSVG